MKTLQEILSFINQFDYEESSALLETILSKHLRGRIYLNQVNKHVEEVYFYTKYYRLLRESQLNPKETVEGYIEKWGFDEMVKYLTDREDRKS